MGDGRALQAGTSHNLGQNFAKAFDIQFQGRDKALQHAWTTSWGVSTRLIGGVIMTHGDDSGLILPPRVAPLPGRHRADPARQLAGDRPAAARRRFATQLVAAGVRVMLDDRDAYTPGWKFAEWEMRGVPLRLEIGPKDIEKGQVVLGAARHAREGAGPDGWPDGRTSACCSTTIQRALLDRALKFREEHTIRGSTYEGFKKIMDGRPGFVVAPWCGDAECEAQIKAETQATLRNIPLDAVRWSAAGPPGPPCLKCGRPAVAEAWFAKAD